MKIITNFFLTLLGLCLMSCEDILEEDITDSMVTIVSPLENTEVVSNMITFRWNPVKGADNYRLQVYSQDQFIVLDSIISTNNFTYSLTSGTYQWRIRAENFAYQTSYTFPSRFTLIESDDLSNQLVPLATPSPSIYSKLLIHNFTWSRLTAADSYSFQLLNVTAGNTVIHQVDDITTTNYLLPTGIISQDGEYTWRVKALNSTNETETQYSSRTLYIDTTPPGLSQNSLPLNNANVTVNTSVNFQWNAPSNIGPVNAPLKYNIQIASDSGFNSILQTADLTTATYSYSFSSTGTYYWRVKAIDTANNEGNYNSGFKVTVQ